MTYNGQAYGSYKEPCHIGPIDVMEIGNSIIWAGRRSDMNDDLTWDLRIRAEDRWTGGGSGQLPLVNATHGAEKLLLPKVLEVTYPPTLDLDWADFGVPSLSREWWEALTESLENMPEESNVAVYCDGGHGRTGTMLSILAVMAGHVPEEGDPVEWVRKNYCPEAVESWSQVRYIEEITGRKVTVLPTSAMKKHTGFVSEPVWKEGEQGWEVEWTKPGDVKKVTGQNYKNVKNGEVVKINSQTSMFNQAKSAVKQLAGKK